MTDSTQAPPDALPDERKKWEFLRDAPERDAGTVEIVSLASALGAVASRSRWPRYTFASLALALARDCVTYQLDTDRVGREQIDGLTDPLEKADVVLTRGVDDCDGKARFFVALCKAGNLPAAMVGRWKGGRLAHVFAQVWLIGPNANRAQWWDAETILRRARLGDVAEKVPKEIDTGKWSQ